jgi:hypothetical protein
MGTLPLIKQMGSRRLHACKGMKRASANAPVLSSSIEFFSCSVIAIEWQDPYQAKRPSKGGEGTRGLKKVVAVGRSMAAGARVMRLTARALEARRPTLSGPEGRTPLL